MSSKKEVAGLFPSNAAIGGVQASGREAWKGIVERVNENAHLFCYEPGSSRISAAVRATRCASGSRTVLVWHLGLLKLLPIIRSTARVVAFLHGIEAWRQQDLLTRLALRRVDLFLSNSSFTWERFLTFNPRLRDVPHESVALGIGKGLTPGTTIAADPAPIALMVGRILRTEDYKGHRQMIESWPTVLDNQPQARLWIVGDGDLRPELERLVLAKGLGGRVQFWGEVSDSVKDRLISESRCLALPSRGEGFGLVYLEAMRAGRPCLVSDCDAGREVVNPPEAGLAVDPDNIQALAGAVSKLLASGSEWDQWSARARSRYESFYTAEQFQRRLVTAMFGSQVVPRDR